MIRKAMRTCAAILAIVLLTGAALADVSIFVATDRHAKYETVRDGGSGPDEAPAPPDGKRPPEDSESARDGASGPDEAPAPPDGKKARKKKLPAYDADGNLIWHNHLTQVMALAAADGVRPEFVVLGGDNVGDGGDKSIDGTGYPIGAPYFSMTAVDAQVKHVFGDSVRGLYTYGSHDIHATDPYEAAFFSGPVAGQGYYIYGVSFAQMIYDTDQQAVDAGYQGKDAADPNGIAAQTASHRFLTWVNGLEDDLPIVVMSHVPLHANRGDNAGAWTWTRALNAAAERHDVIFLWGHNHTVEQRDEGRAVERANYLKVPGEALTVQSWEAGDDGKRLLKRGEELVCQTETLRFIYMNAGYITNGVGSVLTFSDTNDDGHWDRLTVKRYALEPEDAGPRTFELREQGGD